MGASQLRKEKKQGTSMFVTALFIGLFLGFYLGVFVIGMLSIES